MKREKSGVHLLLFLLLIFSATVGFMYGEKKLPETDNNKEKAGIGLLPAAQAIEILLPLIVSRSVEKLVEAMNYIPVQQAHDIVQAIIDTKQFTLSRDDIREIIYGLAANYKETPDQHTILDLMLENEDLQQGLPFLFDVAESSYPFMIPNINAWARERFAKKQNFFKDAEQKAFEHAIEHNASEEMAYLIKHVPFNKDRATKLLWHAIKNNSSPDIVTQLIKAGAHVNAVERGFTPIMRAIDNNNLALVKTLAGFGADLNALHNPRVGNPLQRALGVGNIGIELYLREQGARE